MTRWQYKAFKFEPDGFFQGGKIDAAKMENTLNLLGREGWELTSIVAVNAVDGITRNIAVVLKRPVPETATG